MAMASSQFFCDHQLHPSCNSIRRTTLPSFRPHGSSSFRPKPQFQRTPFLRVRASADRKQVEVCGFSLILLYNPDERINNLADEVDKNTGLSRLTLFHLARITGKRADGFHDLASLFHVHLDKKVPTGAGLGGGSSNAATALWAANQFSGCLATEKELQQWSSEIGSDIPFFFSNGAAFCTGRGEVVKDISLPIPLDIPMVLVKPPQACSTAEVYKRLRLDQTSKVDPITLLEKISKNGISQDVCINDLEPPAFEVLPSLKRLKQRIIAASRGQYDAVFMSGSYSKSSSQTKRLETILST
ncbi:4-diphosphocytidyl-2-C-methyl-D-erythritol kinase, chloroplastic/chromoplastic [Vitis vinifera]|uniref:4-diphosphocytidyl-2-C-methyl-D-erythritol kinase, chloroplastic/chromoplastic n=1 Tax=Vitis vinifera TaxID=29760 RepID=A0A438GUZ2_VITVI|nr:4-diphosphocytidyl-2-C-methyl-D-erythritol kinase, chloroplastic/chromoplastic [Vitis vinifera]